MRPGHTNHNHLSENSIIQPLALFFGFNYRVVLSNVLPWSVFPRVIYGLLHWYPRSNPINKSVVVATRDVQKV